MSTPENASALGPIRERAERATLYELCPGPGMHWHDAYRYHGYSGPCPEPPPPPSVPSAPGFAAFVESGALVNCETVIGAAALAWNAARSDRLSIFVAPREPEVEEAATRPTISDPKPPPSAPTPEPSSSPFIDAEDWPCNTCGRRQSEHCTGYAAHRCAYIPAPARSDSGEADEREALARVICDAIHGEGEWATMHFFLERMWMYAPSPAYRRIIASCRRGADAALRALSQEPSK